jgi:hypothetical protein
MRTKGHTWEGTRIVTAIQHCFYQVLLMLESLANIEEVNVGTVGKSAQKAFLRNVQTHAHLALWCKTTAYLYVENAVIEQMPMGDTYRAWIKLCERFEHREIKSNYLSIEHSFKDCTLAVKMKRMNYNIWSWSTRIPVWARSSRTVCAMNFREGTYN